MTYNYTRRVGQRIVADILGFDRVCRITALHDDGSVTVHVEGLDALATIKDASDIRCDNEQYLAYRARSGTPVRFGAPKALEQLKAVKLKSDAERAKRDLKRAKIADIVRALPASERNALLEQLKEKL